MRVIAGKARRLQLKTPQGRNTRPTTDRIKETLFNMLQDEIVDIHFLDLFSGSGAIGIEALSRGAEWACFVEQDRTAADIIRQNLIHTGLDGQAEIYPCTALSAVRQLQDKMRFHVVFMDPPYGKGLEAELLADPAFYRILQERALIIVEADLHTDLCVREDCFRILKEKIYKTNKHIFLERI
ncbi:MAG: 16S rRNA (guanine(966)-N(2))-methyltransferase RsmD [Lachnospiraceae bacterium]|nr:16S rRNA (guanine(966)-N(2))-methyltransferase RsmD [Lachnospiraceae bacterium]